MTTLRLLTFLPMVLFLGCTTVATRQYRADEEQKILQNVLLAEMEVRDTNRVVFVAIRQADGSHIDPPDAVISTIRAAGIPARKASQSTRDEHTAVIDRGGGQPGIIYYAGVLRWLSNSKVNVVSGSDVAFLGGGFTEFTMEKRQGNWIRTKTKRRVLI